MSEQEQRSVDEAQVDLNNLYREEAYTDLKVASIRKLVPIKEDGSVDESRTALFSGQTQIMSPVGSVLPVQCQLEANNLKEAIEQFPAAIKKAVEEMVEEIKKLQREESSKIIVPGQDMPPMGGSGIIS